MGVKSVLESKNFPKLVQMLSNNESYEVLKEATWVIANLAQNGTNEQIRNFFDFNLIESLCNILANSNENIIYAALECIKCILPKSAIRENKVNTFALLIEECNGVENLEILLTKKLRNREIYNKVQEILDNYYKDDSFYIHNNGFNSVK